MTDLDRLIKLEIQHSDTSDFAEGLTDEELEEMNRLEKQIQEKIEIRIPILEKTCLIYVDKIDKLEQQNKALTEQVKQLEQQLRDKQ